MNEVVRPPVVHLCRRCRVGYEDVRANKVIIGPGGTAHYADAVNTATRCGIIADSDEWWWPF